MPSPSYEPDTHTKPPSRWRRLVARLFDQVLLAAVAIVIGSVTGFGDGWVFATAVGTYAYFVASVRVGASIGKRLLGLTIRGAEGEVPTVWSACGREAFVLLTSIPYGTLLAVIAWVTIARGIRTDPDGRAWHDRLGRTVVTSGT